MEKTPEFDKFARGYAGGEDVSLIRMFGDSFDQFIYVKARWLWNYLNRSQGRLKISDKYNLLDYGCGTGEMLKWLTLFGFPGHLHGADISQAMLTEARKRWNINRKPLWSCIDGTRTDFADNSFSCVVATCVFHHIAPQKRDDVLREIRRILVPGGSLVIFEHNPLNPLTRFVVKRAVIDQDAVLLFPKEMKDRLNNVSLANSLFEYIMFFPPNMKIFNRLEKYLKWLPLGAQYVMVGRKDD